MSVKRRLAEIVKKMYNEGLKDEHFVREATEKTLGGKCWESTENEDKYDHIDFWWNSPKKGRIPMDAKGIKKNSRMFTGCQDGFTASPSMWRSEQRRTFYLSKQPN